MLSFIVVWMVEFSCVWVLRKKNNVMLCIYMKNSSQMPMSSSSNDTSSACNSKLDGEVMVQDPLGV